MKSNRAVVRNALWAFMVLCLFPGFGWSQPLFEDVAPQLGLNLVGNCGGVFWVDFDNDGDQDLMRFRRFSEPTDFYRNDGDHFTPLEGIGLPQVADGGKSMPMDFDHDGDLDVYISGYHLNHMLLVNEGGAYVNRTADLGIEVRNGTRDMTWVDINRDGWMDLMVEFLDGWGLYLNNSGLSFTNATSTTGLPSIYDGSFFAESDVDLDGDIDLYMTVLGAGDHFYKNEGDNSFVDRTAEAGLSGIPTELGCAWVDIDNDKYPDLVASRADFHSIWHNNGDGTFTEMTVHGTGFNAQDGYPRRGFYAIADYDMDGGLDIYVSRPGSCGDGISVNQFFRQVNQVGLEIWFEDIAPANGMNFPEDSYPCWVDYDEDGDLDLYLALHNQGDRLFRNNAVADPGNLQVQVLGPNGERDRWHTRVELYPHGSSDVVAVSELNFCNVARNGFNNYFVVDEDAHYDLRIYFPSGTIMTPEEFPQLSDVVPSAVDNLLTVYMGQQAAPARPPVLTPMTFKLENAYPNPFNATTRIRYSVPATGHVQLAIFNVSGQRVATLVDGNVNWGEHELLWQAEAQASGVYFVELRSGTQVAQQKLLLMK